MYFLRKLSLKDSIHWIYGFCLFLLAMPYFMWGTGSLRILIFLLVSAINLFNKKKVEKSDFIVLPIFFLLILYATKDSNLIGTIYSLLLITFISVDKEKLLAYFQVFKYIFAFSLLLSLIEYVLIVFFSVPLDYNLIEALNSSKLHLYRQYLFLVIQDDLSASFFPRFFGMFDEPGVVGTFAAIILLIDSFNLRKPVNGILFVAGTLSFSFYFIGLSILSFFYLSSNKIRLLGIAVLLALFAFTKNDPIIYPLVWERFEINDGKIQGDNRSTQVLDDYYNAFVESTDFLWGRGQDALISYGEVGSASYKGFVISYGFIFSMVLLLLFVFISMNEIRSIKYIVIFLILFISLLYQRPFLFDPTYFFLIYVSVISLAKVAKCNNKPSSNLTTNYGKLK